MDSSFWLDTINLACADPGIFVRGGQGQSIFFSPQLVLQKLNG